MDTEEVEFPYRTEAACVALLARLLWNETPICDKCGAVGNASKSNRSRFWNCRGCGHLFSVTGKTFLRSSRLDLSDVFFVIWLHVRDPRRPLVDIADDSGQCLKTTTRILSRFALAKAQRDPVAAKLEHEFVNFV